MDKLELPKIIEYVKRTSDKKRRITTTVSMFLLDADVFDMVVAAFVRKELSVLEVRVGVSRKHPDDKDNKQEGIRVARTKTKKVLLPISEIVLTPTKSTLIAGSYKVVKSGNGKIRIFG